MQRTRALFGMVGILGMLFPFLASAQFVPVRDAQLIADFARFAAAFNAYRGDFNTFRNSFTSYDRAFRDTFSNLGGGANTITTGKTDSIRDLISGSNPQGIAAEGCAVDNTSDWIWGPENPRNARVPDAIYGHYAIAPAVSTPTNPSPWRDAINYAVSRSIDPLPEEVPGINTDSRKILLHTRPQVNSSRSLRCLLQELVEWKKLDLSVQIHQLLKEYISDAQTAQLANQAQAQITAGELNFASQGHCSRYADGREECSPLIFTPDYLNQESDRIGRALVDRIAAPASSPIGSAGIPQIFQDDAIAQVIDESTRDSVNSYDTIGNEPCDMTGPDVGLGSENEYENFIQSGFARDSLNQPLSPNLGFFRLNNNSDCYRLGAISGVSDSYRAVQQETTGSILRDAESGSGVLPTMENRDNPSYPYSLYGISSARTQTGNANSDIFRRPADVTFSTLSTCDTPDGCPTTVIQGAANSVADYSGALNYNRRQLASTTNAVHDIVKELYDTMWFGYFDTHTYTAEWAQATMLSIYDSMIFNDKYPGIKTSNLPETATAATYENETPPEF